MHRDTLLPNGLRIVSVAMPHMASVSLGIWVGVGGRHESPGLSGISHFIEHLLFKGTRRRTAAQISQSIEGIGGYLNAFTDEEHTCFYARAHASRLDILADVLLDMYLESRLAPADIEKERTVILDEWSMYRDQPAELVHDLLNETQFPGHALGRPVIGTPATIRRLGRADFLHYLRTRYTAGSTLVVAVGQVRHEDLVRAVEPMARHFRQGDRPGFDPVHEPHPGPRIRLHTKDVEQTALSLGLRTASRHDPRRHALRLLSVLLGENMSSRLFQVVRERHGLTYNIQSSLSTWADTGDIVISAGLDTGEIERTLRLIIRELDRITSRAPGRDELRRALDYVVGQFELGMENTEHHMMWLGEHWLNHGRPVPPEEIKRALAAVTPAQVRNAARDFLQPARRSLALVTPRKSDRGLARILAGG